MTRHTVHVALTFEVDDDAQHAGVPDVDLVRRLVDAVAIDELADAGVRLVSPTPSGDDGTLDRPAAVR